MDDFDDVNDMLDDEELDQEPASAVPSEWPAGVIPPEYIVEKNWRGKKIVKRRYERFPCPRCSTEQVKIYSTGYFTDGFCGARGAYPFFNLADRQHRLGPYTSIYFYKEVKMDEKTRDKVLKKLRHSL